MTFANIYFGLFALWPILAILGGQGFSTFVSIMGLIALTQWRHFRPKATPILIALIIFLAWALYSSTWSAYNPPLISGSLQGQNFAIKSGALRLTLLSILASVLVMMMVQKFKYSRTWWSRYIISVFCIHGVLSMAGSFGFWSQYTSLTLPEEVKHSSEMLQNLTRSQNTFALFVPILLARAKLQTRYEYGVFIGALLYGGIIVSAVIGAMGAVMATLGGIAGCLLAQYFPRLAFRLAFLLLVTLTLSMPVLIGGLSAALEPYRAFIPDSVHSRIMCWEYTLDMIRQAPYVGHGLDTTRTWTQTLGAFPDLAKNFAPHWENYQIVPGHPHNMPLHIWAETGLIGALLLSGVFIACYFKLRKRIVNDAFLAPAISGFIFAFIPIYCTSYGVWNEAFWAGCLILLLSIFLIRSGVKTYD